MVRFAVVVPLYHAPLTTGRLLPYVGIPLRIAGQKYIQVMIHGVYVGQDLIWRGEGAKKAVTRKNSNIIHRFSLT
jgi:hypothetical protein